MASSSISSSSPSSAPAFFSRYHVFLSFRGDDTRNNIVGHLYSALENKGIQTYKDDKTLRQGETIGPALMKGIDESQIALVVFSDNYADSSWCLNELVYIMNRKETRGKIVIPVFYKVDPSEVRKQKGKFGEALAKAKHELKDTTKLESWRKALEDAGSISGFHYEDPATRDESEFIKDIVKKVLQNMRPLTSRVNDNLVGIETRMEDLESKLHIGSGGAGMIGIWGVGGGGKTTLAFSFYDKISGGFDGHCFVEDVQEKSNKNGLESLQEKILSDVLKQDKVRVRGVNEGKHLIRDGLCGKKVLIVLDDVNKRNQLEALAGKHNWFGEGSLIIITTRDEHLLNAHRVDVIHEISLFKDDEAIQLFCRHAFRHHKPKEGYHQLSKEVVTYAGGLPLALTVIGCFLCDKDMKEWRSALARLKAIPEDEILEKLKISFDGLKLIEKELFLDIACFFRRKNKDEAMEILSACGFHPDIGVKVLTEKALVTISENGKFDMHDLIQEMAHYIVRGDQTKNPEKHSRIWEMEDVVKICAMDPKTELDMIEAIHYRYSGFLWDNPLEDVPPMVANTKNLRWIDWEGHLASPLLTNFPQRTLCCLKLYNSFQEQLWEGRKNLPNLKILDLVALNNLITTPDFSGLPNLEILKLHKLWGLEEVHSSLGDLKRLVTLSIKVCEGIKVFPSITRLTNLNTLSFSDNPRLFGLSEIQQNNMNYCIRLGFPLRDLKKLNLSVCRLGDEDIGSSVWELPNVQELNLASNDFSRLDFSVFRVPKLKWLNVSGCSRLVALSDLPSSIAVVQANYCRSLKTFGDISSCKWLWKVSLLHGYKVDPIDGGMLLDSMLRGNAIEDHFISFCLEHQIPMGFLGRFFGGKTFTKRLPDDSGTFTLHLPPDWDDDFCGFLIRLVTQDIGMDIDIIIKQEADEEDSGFEIWQESDEAPEPEFDGEEVNTRVGYVSFNSLRRTTLLTSSYNIISFCISNMNWTSFTAELVPRRSKDDPVQTRDCSDFGNKDYKYRSGFVIKHDSKSTIKILGNKEFIF